MAQKEPNLEGKDTSKGSGSKSTKNTNRGKVPHKGKKSFRGKIVDKDSRTSSSDFKDSSCNDISWYAQDATLLRNTANFPWSTQTGLTYDDDATVVTAGNVVNIVPRKFTSPGICAIQVLPGLGNTAYELDAPNIAANAMYVYIRHMNSGAKNYDAPDLMNYVLAMDEVFSAINFAQRLYGTLGMYSVYNRYTPDALITTQGIDAKDLRENMVQFRYRLNTIIKQAATLVVPNSFPIFLRHAFLFQNYYIEGDDMKDQIYFYTPVNFRKFNIPEEGGPGELVYDTIKPTGTPAFRLDPNNQITGGQLLDYIQDMVSRIYLDEDFGIMAGDILKAYGEGGVVRLSELPDSYVCTLNPNNEVLLQMKNCNIATSILPAFDYANRTGSDPYYPKFGNIYQDPNSNKIYESLTIRLSVAHPAELLDRNSHMLTLEGDPSPEMNMLMTRCVHGYQVASNVDRLTYTCGTEIAVAMIIVTDVDPYKHYKIGSFVGATADDGQSLAIQSDVISVLSSFKYHPCVYHVISSTSPITVANVVSLGRNFQVDNFTIISDDMLDRLNQVAIMSEFNVPHMALIK